MIPENDGKDFLILARRTIEGVFQDKVPVNSGLKQRYKKKQGVFVTLHKDGDLRGCIGYPEPILPLYEAMVDAARNAAFRDPRFSPLTEDELETIDLEISILTVPGLIDTPPESYEKHIRIGTDGLIIRGRSSGLLLPQVALEWNFSPRRFLECVCEKAGMHKDAWKDPANKIYTFQAQIFEEKVI